MMSANGTSRTSHVHRRTIHVHECLHCGDANWWRWPLHPRQRHDLHDFYPCAGHEDGLCRISSWPHHAIRPARPNSLRPHFLCLRLRSKSTRLVFPNGAPPSTMDVLLAFIHFIQASIPFFCCSGVEFFIIFSNSGPEAIYSTMNFFHRIFPRSGNRRPCSDVAIESHAPPLPLAPCSVLVRL